MKIAEILRTIAEKWACVWKMLAIAQKIAKTAISQVRSPAVRRDVVHRFCIPPRTHLDMPLSWVRLSKRLPIGDFMRFILFVLLIAWIGICGQANALPAGQPVVQGAQRVP